MAILFRILFTLGLLFLQISDLSGEPCLSFPHSLETTRLCLNCVVDTFLHTEIEEEKRKNCKRCVRGDITYRSMTLSVQCENASCVNDDVINDLPIYMAEELKLTDLLSGLPGK